MQLQWAGLGALTYVAGFLFAMGLGFIQIDGSQAPVNVMILVASGAMFLSLWARFTVIRHLSRQFFWAYEFCIVVLAALSAVGVLQLMDGPHDRLTLGTELIWCVVLALCGVFVGPFANTLAHKVLKRQGYL